MRQINYGEDAEGDPLHADIESYDDGRYRVEYNSIPDDPALAIVQAISTITRTDPLELKPLQTVIDTDALNRLFSTTGKDSQFSFRYANFDIIVTNSDTIICEKLSEETD